MQVSAELFISQPGFKLPVSGRLSAPPTQPSRDSYVASPPGGTPQCKGQVLAAQGVLPLQPHRERAVCPRASDLASLTLISTSKNHSMCKGPVW